MGRTATLQRRPAVRNRRTAGSTQKQPGQPTRKATRKGGIRTFRAAFNYLSGQVNYERRPLSPGKKNQMGLSRITRLLADLGNPQKSLRTVHIAGSKGKGSTATMLLHMLKANGLKVGLYTSPHLLDIRERIMIGSEKISEAEFTRLVAKIAKIVAGYKTGSPSFFDMLTAMAFKYFADREVDVAIIETGLGGRLDSTNVIEPEVCGLTSISFDHVPQLGTTLTDIASEKAGVFKKGITVISAQQPTEVKRALKKAAEQSRSPLMFVGDEIEFTYRFESSRAVGPQARIGLTTPNSRYDHLAVPLVGQHQAVNCGVAIGLLDELKNRGFEIDDEAAVTGLSKVSLPGRMQSLCTSPRVVADAAHNASSISALMRAIGQNVPYDSMVVIFGCCADKDVNGMLEHILLGADKVIFTKFDSPRAADPGELAQAFTEVTSGRMAQTASTLAKAVEIAEKAVGREDLICITGSFYLVGEAIKFFEDHPHHA